jgi:hypothetical protein
MAPSASTATAKTERYWNLVRLGDGGDRRTEMLPQVQQWFVANIGSGLEDGEIQKQLLKSSEKSAQLALRCFISHQIEQVCQQLALQFGTTHGFTRRDLLAYVLDDDGRDRTSYQPLSVKILASFDPARASLGTWAMRLVKHHRELNQFLVECGVYLLSDWAILNDTNGPKLRRILTEYQPTARTEIEKAIALLEAYHEVYRNDRLIARQSGVRGSCPAPTPEQLGRMAALLDVPAQGLLNQLRRLADGLRQYRLATRGGQMKTVSLDAKNEDDQTLGDRIAAPSSHDSEGEASVGAFLSAYRAQFGQALVGGFEQVVAARRQKLKPPKDGHFLMGMQLFHCQGLSMTDIAPKVGLQAQFQVSRLLNLKAFREDVRHALLLKLKASVQELAARFGEGDRLIQLDGQVEAALNEQIEQLIQDASSQAQTPKEYASMSVFSRTLCEYLDRLEVA